MTIPFSHRHFHAQRLCIRAIHQPIRRQKCVPRRRRTNGPKPSPRWVNRFSFFHCNINLKSSWNVHRSENQRKTKVLVFCLLRSFKLRSPRTKIFSAFWLRVGRGVPVTAVFSSAPIFFARNSFNASVENQEKTWLDEKFLLALRIVGVYRFFMDFLYWYFRRKKRAKKQRRKSATTRF